MNDKPAGVARKYETMASHFKKEINKSEKTDRNGGDTGVEITLKKRYDAVSKNGDTLELSSIGKLMKQNSSKSIAAAKNSAGGKNIGQYFGGLF